MEDPAQEIPHVIRSLTQTPPSIQHATIEKYFTKDASFTHPFCRTGSFYINETVHSRNAIVGVYRWYKIMSPTIELRVDSVAFDKPSLLLYAQISQSFRIWIIPFYNAHVSLVTVLQLVQDKKSSKYLITSQNDLYQVNEFVKFFWFGGWLVVGLWQILAAGVCAVAALVLWPLTWVEENWAREGWRGIGQG